MDQLFLHEAYVPQNLFLYGEIIPYKYVFIIYKNGNINLYSYIYNIGDNTELISQIFIVQNNHYSERKYLIKLINVVKFIFIGNYSLNALKEYEKNIHFICILIKKIKSNTSLVNYYIKEINKLKEKSNTINDEIKNDLNDEIKNDLSDEIKNDLNDEIKNDLNDEIKNDLNDEIKNDLNNDFKKLIKDQKLALQQSTEHIVKLEYDFENLIKYQNLIIKQKDDYIINLENDFENLIKYQNLTIQQKVENNFDKLIKSHDLNNQLRNEIIVTLENKLKNSNEEIMKIKLLLELKINENIHLNNNLKKKDIKITELNNHKINNSEKQLKERMNKLFLENNDHKNKIKKYNLENIELKKNIDKPYLEITRIYKSYKNNVVSLKISLIVNLFLIFIILYLCYCINN